jgi:IMP dehydrogenase
MFNNNYSFGTSNPFQTTHKNYSFGASTQPDFNKQSVGSPQTNPQTQTSFLYTQPTQPTQPPYTQPTQPTQPIQPTQQFPQQQQPQQFQQQPPQQPPQQLPQQFQPQQFQPQQLPQQTIVDEKDSSKKAKSLNDINIIPVLTNIKSQNDISLSTNITKNLSLSTPIVSLSNNIDNIINMNLLGGLGVFDNSKGIDNLENQIQFINTVKNYLKFIDETPITIYSNSTFEEIKNTFLQYSLDYIAVIDETNTFLGFITYSYFNLVSVLDNNIYAHQIMIPLEKLKYYKTYEHNWNDLLTERPNIDIINNLKIFQFIPIISDNNTLQGVITLKNFTNFYKYRNKALIDKKGKLITAISTCIFSDSIDRIKKLVNIGLDIIFFQIDNAYNNCLVNIIKDIKSKFPSLKIIIGNIHSSNAFKYLCEAGVDSISVGNGTEFGQFTLLQECFELSKLYNVPIINNSGNPTQNNNIFKSFAAGSHSFLITDDIKFNYTIENVLEIIKNGLVSLNIIDINHLHSTNIEYVITK